MAYQTTLTALETHLQSLTNPYAVEPVVHKLQEVFENWDHAQAVFNQFNEIACNKQTILVLQKFSAVLYDSRLEFTDRKRRTDFVAKVVRVSKGILGSTQAKRDQYAEEHLKILLKSPTARGLADEAIQALFSNLGNRGAWRVFAGKTFRGEEFDAYLKANYPNYYNGESHDRMANFIMQVYNNRLTSSSQSLQQLHEKQKNEQCVELTKKQRDLCCYWLRNENTELLLQLIACHLNGENVNVDGQKEVVELLRGIVDLSHKLDIPITKEGALIKSLKSAHHEHWLKTGNDFVIGNALERMQEADQHLEKVQGKEAILFVGDKKAGKSASIAYFLGARFDLEQGLLKLVEEQKELPSIGDSTEIFQVPHKIAYTVSTSQLENTVLLDSISTNGCMEKDHELCDHLSQDLVVQNVSRIKAIVLVIPFSYFSSDSFGSDISELIIGTSKQLSGLWESDGVHVLVTHAEDQLTADIEDGTRFTERADSIRKMMERETGSEHHAALGQQLQVWDYLIKLHGEGKVHIFDFQDTNKREKLLAHYKEGSADFKEGYVPFLLTGYGREKFEESMEEYMGAWTGLIDEYLNIPGQIGLSSQNIENIKENVKRLETMIDLFNLAIDHIDKIRTDLETIVDLLEEKEYISLLKIILAGGFDAIQQVGQLVEEWLTKINNLDKARQQSFQNKEFVLIDNYSDLSWVFDLDKSVVLNPGKMVALFGPIRALTLSKFVINAIPRTLSRAIEGAALQQEKCRESINALRENIKAMQDARILPSDNNSLEEKQQNLENLFACEDKTLNILSPFSEFILSLDHSEDEPEFTKCYRGFRESFAKLQKARGVKE